MRTVFSDVLTAKPLVIFVAAAVLLPNLYVVVRGTESFPFTSAPMFAHYIGPQTPLYMFEFRGVTAAGDVVVLDPGLSGRGESMTIRLFFSRYYGSMHPRSPFGDRVDDNAEKFTARLATFFQAYAGAVRRSKTVPPLREIQLFVNRVDRNRTVLETRQLGTYNVQRRDYTVVWAPRP